VLHATGQTLAGALGPNDIIGRWSEDRLLAVVTGCSASTLLRAANMMKRLVKLQGVPWWGGRLAVSISMGGTLVRSEDTSASLVSRADAVLDRSLLQMGDCVEVA
jgi:GGDEF domain-containing protein